MSLSAVTPMIRLENVTKSYSADVVALRDASFDVAKGEFVFLVGPSGSGKSTLLRLLNRQDRPERGAVWVAGRNIIDMPPGRVPHLRRNIGNIFQDYKLLSNKTRVRERRLRPGGDRQARSTSSASRCPAVLDLVGLAGKEERFPHQLSGGEQQRVSIARAFVNRPLILLADEPTGNLDPATGEGIMRLLDRINKTGTTVVMATHDQRIVNTMRKRVIQLDRGVIVRDQARGVYELIAMRPASRYTLRETWASFRRNVTLTVAAIITSAVSLLIFGLTLLIQHGFDNLLSAVGGRRRDDRLRQRRPPPTTRRRSIEQALKRAGSASIETCTYCDATCSLAEADACSPATRRSLTLLDREQHPDAVQGRADRRHRRRVAADSSATAFERTPERVRGRRSPRSRST